MKKEGLIVSLFIIFVLLTGCGNKIHNIEKDRELKDDIVIPEDEILIINRSVNYAWGYYDEGTFIDSKGDVYTFSFSQMSYRDSGEEGDELVNKLKIVRDNSEPFAHIDESNLKEIYELGMKLDVDAKLEEEFTACDAGENIQYFYNTDYNKLLTCWEEGDMTGQIPGQDVQAFIKYYEKCLDSSIEKQANPNNDMYNNMYTFYYGESDLLIENLHSGYTGCNGKYVITNKSELNAFKSLSDTGKLDAAANVIKENMDELSGYIYFVMVTDIPPLENEINAQGIIYYQGTIDFVMSENNVLSEDDMDQNTNDGFICIGAFPLAVAEQYTSSYTEVFKDGDNNAWIVP